LIDVSHGRRVGSEPQWPLVGSNGKKLVTLLFWYRQINCSYRLIDWHALIDDVSYARRVDSEPKWPLVGSFGKKLVTLLFWYRQINCSYRLIDWHALID
jgi:hypothetical protein